MTRRTELPNFRFFWMLALSLSAFVGRTGNVNAQPPQKWTDQDFEEWVFDDDGTAAGNRKRFELLLHLRIEEIDRVCHLTNDQKKKLELMGTGEIKNVFDMYEIAKRHFNRLNNDPQRLEEVLPFSRPVALAIATMFQERSLLIRSLRHTLNENQLAEYEMMAKERREFDHKAQIELAVHTLEAPAPLRDSQRRDLVALLTKEIASSKTSRPYSLYIIMYKVSLLMDDKTKPILTEVQRKVWRRQLDNFKAVLARFRQRGIDLDEDGVADIAKEAPQK
jgi:hypothetical protein